MMTKPLHGKVGLIVGVANQDSIAAGCARALSAAGADLVLTCKDDTSLPYAQKVAQASGESLLTVMDVRNEDQVDAVFAQIENKFGKLDFLVHSIAFCRKDDLYGRIVDSSAQGFAEAMDISCHSFLRLARRAEPLMKDGGTLLTMSFYGAQSVIQDYGIMGPVKAALEASVRYLAAELGSSGIRVHALSPGPIKTRAASGLKNIGGLIEDAQSRAPLSSLATIDDIGAYARFLVGDDARALTGSIAYVDAGYNIIGDVGDG